MATCRKCGKNLIKKDKFCPYCGTVRTNPIPLQYHGHDTSDPSDTGSFGWGLLGFCFPIIGLVLYLVWIKQKPNNARSVGTGMFIAFILWFFTALVGAAIR